MTSQEEMVSSLFLLKKLKTLTKAVVMKRKMHQCFFFLACFKLQLSKFLSLEILVLASGPNFQVHKSRVSLQFQSFVKIYLENTVPFNEKRG